MTEQASKSRSVLRIVAPWATLGVAIALAMIVTMQLQSQRDLTHATLLPQAISLPEFDLIDQDGRAFDRDALRGRLSLLFFGFTHCPDICPITLQQLAVARRRIAERDVDSELPRIIFVSVDPDRDDMAALARYVAAFGDDVTGVTGTLPELNKLTSALGIFHDRLQDQDGNVVVEHSGAVVVIDTEGAYRAVFSAPHAVDALVNDLLLLMQMA